MGLQVIFNQRKKRRLRRTIIEPLFNANFCILDFTEKSIKKAFMDNANFMLNSELNEPTGGLNTIVQNNKALVALSIVLVCDKTMDEVRFVIYF